MSKIVVKDTTIRLIDGNDEIRAKFCFYSGVYIARAGELGHWATCLDGPEPSIRFCSKGSGAKKYIIHVAQNIGDSIEVPVFCQPIDEFVVMAPSSVHRVYQQGFYWCFESVQALTESLPSLYMQFSHPLTVFKKRKDGCLVDITSCISFTGNAVNIVLPNDDEAAVSVRVPKAQVRKKGEQ